MNSVFTVCLVVLSSLVLNAQNWELTTTNIEKAIKDAAPKLNADPFRPAFHLTPPAGCMGDPNGGIYHDGWYHIFYGLHPFAFHPGGWYWAHARSKDLLHWEHMKPTLTPPKEFGLQAIGSGSTIINVEGKPLAFYSQSREGEMEFWRATFDNDNLSTWNHIGKNPILTLNHPGLPPFDKFWRDPYVFTTGGRTFLIACADLFDQNYVAIPIFEAKDDDLTDWEYKGILFEVPKHQYRNLEVPELIPLEDKWIFMASTDAPIDRVVYFLGDFDLENLTYNIDYDGVIDYSGHYYAQESITDDKGNLYLLSWIPGWDRDWLPYYMNEPLKTSNPIWNGCFSIPRKLELVDGQLRQSPLEAIKQLRREYFTLSSRELPVSGPFTAIEVIDGFTGNQIEMVAKFSLQNASFCGINILANQEGIGGLPIVWSGDVLNVDGVNVQIKEWTIGDTIELHIFVDKKMVEVFVNGGKYCISRQVREENVKGENIALTALGGTAKLVSLDAWKLASIN